MTASHSGTQPPSTGMQPHRIFDHYVPKEKRVALSCLYFSAPCLAYRSILSLSLSCHPFCSALRPVPQSIMPFTLSCSALCPLLLNILPFALPLAFLPLMPLLALPCPVLPSPALASVPAPALSCPALDLPLPLPLPCRALPCPLLPCPALSLCLALLSCLPPCSALGLCTPSSCSLSCSTLNLSSHPTLCYVIYPALLFFPPYQSLCVYLPLVPSSSCIAFHAAPVCIHRDFYLPSCHPALSTASLLSIFWRPIYAPPPSMLSCPPASPYSASFALFFFFSSTHIAPSLSCPPL